MSIHSTCTECSVDRKRKHKAKSIHPSRTEDGIFDTLDAPSDFNRLKDVHPILNDYLFLTRDGSLSIDFSNSAATLELTKAILKADYDLDWNIPLGHLIPPIPCRVSYIHWIHALLQLSEDIQRPVVGLDIGCGANCIYPLLGASLHGWRFVGTDITDSAVHHARNNAYRNSKSQHLIDIMKVRGNELIISAVKEFGRFHFSMCNPPFFESIEEAGQNRRTAFGGTAEEMVYPGGEMAFVEKMVEESTMLGSQILWYSTMFGKKSTFKKVSK